MNQTKLEKAACRVLWRAFDRLQDPPDDWTKIEVEFKHMGKKYKATAQMKDGTDQAIATNIVVKSIK